MSENFFEREHQRSRRRFGTQITNTVASGGAGSSKKVKVRRPTTQKGTETKKTKRITLMPGRVGVQLEPCKEYAARISRFVDGGPGPSAGQARKSGISPGDFVLSAEAAGAVGTTYQTIIDVLKMSHSVRELVIVPAWEDACKMNDRSPSSPLADISSFSAEDEASVDSAQVECSQEPSINGHLSPISRFAIASTNRSASFVESAERLEANSLGECLSNSASPDRRSFSPSHIKKLASFYRHWNVRPETLLFVLGSASNLYKKVATPIARWNTDSAENPSSSVPLNETFSRVTTGSTGRSNDEPHATKLILLKELSQAKAVLNSRDTSNQEWQEQMEKLFRENVALHQNFENKLRLVRLEHTKTERELKDFYSGLVGQHERRIRELEATNEELRKKLSASARRPPLDNQTSTPSKSKYEDSNAETSGEFRGDPRQRVSESVLASINDQVDESAQSVIDTRDLWVRGRCQCRLGSFRSRGDVESIDSKTAFDFAPVLLQQLTDGTNSAEKFCTEVEGEEIVEEWEKRYFNPDSMEAPDAQSTGTQDENQEKELQSVIEEIRSENRELQSRLARALSEIETYYGTLLDCVEAQVSSSYQEMSLDSSEGEICCVLPEAISGLEDTSTAPCALSSSYESGPTHLFGNHELISTSGSYLLECTEHCQSESSEAIFEWKAQLEDEFFLFHDAMLQLAPALSTPVEDAFKTKDNEIRKLIKCFDSARLENKALGALCLVLRRKIVESSNQVKNLHRQIEKLRSLESKLSTASEAAQRTLQSLHPEIKVFSHRSLSERYLSSSSCCDSLEMVAVTNLSGDTDDTNVCNAGIIPQIVPYDGHEGVREGSGTVRSYHVAERSLWATSGYLVQITREILSTPAPPYHQRLWSCRDSVNWQLKNDACTFLKDRPLPLNDESSDKDFLCLPVPQDHNITRIVRCDDLAERFEPTYPVPSKKMLLLQIDRLQAFHSMRPIGKKKESTDSRRRTVVLGIQKRVTLSEYDSSEENEHEFWLVSLHHGMVPVEAGSRSEIRSLYGADEKSESIIKEPPSVLNENGSNWMDPLEQVQQQLGVLERERDEFKRLLFNHQVDLQQKVAETQSAVLQLSKYRVLLQLQQRIATVNLCSIEDVANRGHVHEQHINERSMEGDLETLDWQMQNSRLRAERLSVEERHKTVMFELILQSTRRRMKEESANQLQQVQRCAQEAENYLHKMQDRLARAEASSLLASRRSVIHEIETRATRSSNGLLHAKLESFAHIATTRIRAAEEERDRARELLWTLERDSNERLMAMERSCVQARKYNVLRELEYRSVLERRDEIDLALLVLEDNNDDLRRSLQSIRDEATRMQRQNMGLSKLLDHEKSKAGDLELQLYEYSTKVDALETINEDMLSDNKSLADTVKNLQAEICMLLAGSQKKRMDDMLRHLYVANCRLVGFIASSRRGKEIPEPHEKERLLMRVAKLTMALTQAREKIWLQSKELENLRKTASIPSSQQEHPRFVNGSIAIFPGAVQKADTGFASSQDYDELYKHLEESFATSVQIAFLKERLRDFENIFLVKECDVLRPENLLSQPSPNSTGSARLPAGCEISARNRNALPAKSFRNPPPTGFAALHIANSVLEKKVTALKSRCFRRWSTFAASAIITPTQLDCSLALTEELLNMRLKLSRLTRGGMLVPKKK